MPWVGPKDLHERFIYKAEEYLTAEGSENGTRVAPPNSVLIVVRSMALAKGVQIGITTREVAFNQDIKAIIPTDDVDPHYLFYALWGRAEQLHHLVDEASHGTKRLRTDVLGDFEIALPPLFEQRRIAEFVGALDEKIENNRRIAQILEQVVATIFQAYFVDFINQHRFYDSKLGRVPEGWDVGSVRDVCVLEYGKALPATVREPGAAAVVGSSGVVGSHKESLYKGPGIVVGRKGTAGSVQWVRSNFFPIDTTFAALAKKGVPLLYLLHALRQVNLPHVVADSAVPGLNRDAAYDQSLFLPPLSEMESFERAASPCYALRDHLLTAAMTLEALRDTLLPYLISGQIRVPTLA